MGAWYRLTVNGLTTHLPRALFFDLDGTLLAPGAVLTHRTAEVVRTVAECGAAIVLATGGFSARTHLLAGILRRTIPGGVWAVTHNGAAVWDPNGRLVRHQPMPPAALEAAMAVAGPRVWVTYETVDAAGKTAVYYAGRMRGELAHFVWGPQGSGIRAHAGQRQGWQGGQEDRSNADGEVGEHGEQGASEVDSDAGDAVERVPRGGLAVGLEPRWDWRRARSPETFRRSDVLGCWCVGSPAALAPLDAQADGESLHGARYLPWGSRLGQILGQPRLRLVGRELGARAASKG
ncbi:MAG: HAD family hydrolase, partial [Chloroflexota bacterium]